MAARNLPLPFAPPAWDGKRRLCLDPSPTSTGICTDCGDGAIAFWNRDFKEEAEAPRYGWEGRLLLIWNRFVAYELRRLEAHELAIEIPAIRAQAGIWDGGAVVAMFWNAVGTAQNLGVALQMVPNSSLKVAVLGPGNGRARWKDHLDTMRAMGFGVRQADEATAVAIMLWARGYPA